jgi:nucleoside-diphosphate-sugar epimerase
MTERRCFVISARCVVTGAGGFLGHHLVRALKQRGAWVRGVDLKDPQFEPTDADEFVRADLREFDACQAATEGVVDVYNLAADMGGIGFITRYLASVARNNSLINLNMLEASQQNGVRRFLFTSSACVYNQEKQRRPDIAGLAEDDAHPAAPESGYGWEKLYAEQLCDYYRQDFGLDTRVVRLHNVYGPLGCYEGGREKAPAAACRKVAMADWGGPVEVWGDGLQTRSFLYVDDCVEGLLRLMESGYTRPINLGSEELVTIEQLFDLVSEIAGKSISKIFDPTQPQGVRGRNSDNRRLRDVLGWAPSTPLRVGLAATYRWIERQVMDRDKLPSTRDRLEGALRSVSAT